MGLLCRLDLDEVGVPRTVSEEVESFEGMDEEGNMDMGTEEMEVEVDYTMALETFVDVFETYAHQLVPVDTGYLQGSIGGTSDWDGAEVWAEAEYAQYVEYGTTYQSAQPYFEPALEYAWAAFCAAAEQCRDEAQATLSGMVSAFQQGTQAAIEASLQSMGWQGDTWMAGFVGSVAIMWLLFPVALLMYGVMKEVQSALIWPSGLSDVKPIPFDQTGLTVEIT